MSDYKKNHSRDAYLIVGSGFVGALMSDMVQKILSDMTDLGNWIGFLISVCVVFLLALMIIKISDTV